MENYHRVWLLAHPERSEKWLAERLADGFHVHHVDGDHGNDDPKNLVLIEAGDHFMLHNGSKRLLWCPIAPGRNRGGRPKKQVAEVVVGEPVNRADALFQRCMRKIARMGV